MDINVVDRLQTVLVINITHRTTMLCKVNHHIILWEKEQWILWCEDIAQFPNLKVFHILFSKTIFVSKYAALIYIAIVYRLQHSH